MTSEQWHSLGHVFMWVSWSGFVILTLAGNWGRRQREAALKAIEAELNRRALQGSSDSLLEYVRCIVKYDFESARMYQKKLEEERLEGL